jgi:predicted ATPase/class 3 adenylate cyclase
MPSGTVTFLFTDIEGSTRLWEEHPDAMRPALALHDEILRDAITAHGGYVVKTTGDGAHAAFATAQDAIEAAVSAQLSLGAQEWPVSTTVRVRMGIHSGPAELRNGDYYGTSVNRAARIMSVGHGGQVVISAATQELVRGAGIEVIDLGDHRLKDLGEPERIFQIVHPGLEHEFPPLRSLDVFNTNLPAQRTSFVGRDAERADVKDALTDARLVTLTGVGGVGKTRLAVQVAADLLSEHPDGVWFVDLAAVGDPTAVPDAVAAAVGLVPQPGLTTTATIVEAFAGRRSLLVLDNCEHLLDAAADLVEAVLDRSGPAKVLATSREGLGVAAERLWPVPSLGGRDGTDEAVALFVDRARAVNPEFQVEKPGTVEAVDEICQRLDRMPLAIELAAARTIAMSPTELRDRLDDRFRLLAGSRRGMERHQTLRHAVQWSYDLLTEDERNVLELCAVFAGGFELEAAAAVAGDGALDDYTVLDLLEALVRKSLVTVDRTSSPTRYGMLETIRQFAEDELARRGDLIDTRARHARYYAVRVQAVSSWLGDPARATKVGAWFDTELANLRVAFRDAADDHDLDTAATVAAFATVAGFFRERYEPAAWAEELIPAAQERRHPMLAALCAAAAMCSTCGRVDDAIGYAEVAYTLLSDPHSQLLPFGASTTLVAAAYNACGRPDRWAEFCRAELAQCSDREISLEAALVIALALTQRYDEATALADAVVAQAEASGIPYWHFASLLGFCLANFDRDPPAALAAIRRGAEISREWGGVFSGVAANLARAEAAYGDNHTAVDACDEALRAYSAAGDRTGACTVLWVLASLLHRLGRDDAAAVVAGSGLGPALGAYPELVAAIDEIRTTLGEERFETSIGRGRNMDNTTAFRFALDEIEAARAVV